MARYSVGDMVKIGLIAAVFIWLLKWVFSMVNVPVITPAVEGL